MRRALGFAAVWLGLLTGCPFSFTNEDHCAARAGDATCAADDPSTPFCALDGCGLYDEVTNRTGCVAEQPTDMACYSPCGGKLDANAMSDCEAATEATTETPTTDTDTDTASSGTGTTEAPDTDPDTTDGCACEGDTPICTDGECVPCMTDEECVESVGEGLLCYEGRCVPCRPTTDPLLATRHEGCSDDAPNCVGDTCVAQCLLPEDCDSAACDPAESACAPQGCELLTGLCGTSERIYYVSSLALEDGDGSRESPFNTIERALQEIPSRASANDAVGVILLAPGAMYAESIAFGGKSVIVRPWGPGPTPVISPRGTMPVFTLLNDESSEPGVLYLDHVRVQHPDGPVALLNSSTRFFSDGSEFLDNAEGIQSDGGFAYLRNTVFARTVGPVFTVTSDASLDIEASTIIENEADVWLDCSAGAKDQTRVGIRDSIVGLYDGPEFSTLISPECLLVESNNVLGDVGVEGDYRDDFRLELMPGEMFTIDPPETCEPGESELPGDQLCAPRLDIDGKSRDGMPLAGASVP